MKKLFLLFILITAGTAALGQKAFSIASDLSVLQNLNKDQKFVVWGQHVRAYFHLAPKTTLYTYISYYSRGEYSNTLTAPAYDTATIPQQLEYTATSNLLYRNLSLGLLHYFKGAYNSEETWNLYGSAGFGLLTGRLENTHDPQVDTALYAKPELSIEGTGNFKRLTLDLALGVEMPIGAGIFIYGEARTWLRASNYPSPYLYNNNVPSVVILSGGLRLLID